MNVQDIYSIGIALHGEIIRLKIHSAKSPAEFEERWNTAIANVKARIETGQIDIIDHASLRSVDWMRKP